MRSRRSGFTIVEMITVIVIIAILSTISIFSYSAIKATANNAAMGAKATVISEALEKYYDQTGLYPSCADMTQTINVVAASVLTGIDPNVLTGVGATQGTNSVTCGTLDSTSDITAFGYSPGLTQFALTYVEEGTTTVKSTSSRRISSLVPAAPSAPVLTVGLVSGNVRADITPLTCSSDSTIQYQIQSRTNNGTWSGYSSWTGTTTFTQTPSAGVKYSYQAQARCINLSRGLFSNTVTTSEVAYVHPIPLPTTPVVTATKSGASTTWSWTTTCSTGTPRYQYDYTISPVSYDSGWVATAAASVAFTTATAGQTYSLAVQAQCYNSFYDPVSSWTASGSASYTSGSTWIAAWGGTGNDNVYTWDEDDYMTQTSDGGFVFTGITYTSDASGDMFIAKFTSTGGLQWAKTWGNTAVLDAGRSVIQTSDGGYAVTGLTNTSNTSTDAVLVRFDSSGTFLWATYWGGSTAGYYDEAASVIQTIDGGYAVTGGTESYGTGALGTYEDMFIAKFTPSGTLSWLNTWGVATFNETGTSIIQTNDGSYAVGGYYRGVGNTDAFIAKFDWNGNNLWATTYGGASYVDFGTSIIQTSDGGYAMVGYTLSFGAGALGTYNNGYLAKFTSTGALSWSTTWGKVTTQSYGFGVIQTSDGGYAIAGTTNGFGAGGYDYMLAKYTSAGVLSWSSTWGGTGTDWAESVRQTSDGGYALFGYTNSYGAGSYDLAIARFDSGGNIANCATNCSRPAATVNTYTTGAATLNLTSVRQSVVTSGTLTNYSNTLNASLTNIVYP